jgi:Rrf2 family protein
MIYSKSAEYAIQAMIYLAEHHEKGNVMVSQIAEDYDIPRHFLAKLVQSLTKHHLVKSTRGRTGGLKLNKPARDIRIIDVVYAIEGPPPEEEMCVIGLDVCSDSVPCPLHDQWKVIKENIRSMLSYENLEDLAKETVRKRNFLKEQGVIV